MRKINTTIWALLSVMIAIASSCKDGEDVNDTSEYKYYLEIQSQVRLHLSKNTEDENEIDNQLFDR